MPNEMLFVFLVFFIALMYSAVGHGGASSYLALMTLWGEMSIGSIRSAALMLNAMVSLISFVHYANKGYFKFKLSWPFILTSVPMAFWGSSCAVDPELYRRILGVLLLFAIVRLLGFFNLEQQKKEEISIPFALLTGAGIGFLSGLIGIGGGIILSPLILLLGWGDMKETAATSALFILVNSLSGILGLAQHQQFFLSENLMVWMLTALAGGFAGAYWGSRHAPVKKMSYVLGVVLLMASVKLVLF